MLPVFGVCSRKLSRDAVAGRLLGARLEFVPPGRAPAEASAMLGWGRKRAALRARKLAARHGLPFISVEDGFLRSFGLGVNGIPALSVVVDDLGVYFDARSESRFERLLQQGGFEPELLQEAERVLQWLRDHRLTKYNVGDEVPPGTFDPGMNRVLVVDQTAGDASIAGGLADEGSFIRMLEAAVRENPGSEVWVKTHPDVLAGRRKSCLSGARTQPNLRWITEDWHPHSLLPHFDRVYVVSSQLGLDALIAGKPVSCFGVPFYAGWGLTDDRVACPRRSARRTLPELIAVAYLRYPCYLDPVTWGQGNFFQVAAFVVRQRETVARFPRRVFCVGFEFWKRRYVRPFLPAREVRFLRSIGQLAAAAPGGDDVVACWSVPSDSLVSLVREAGCRLWRMEDGFYRSVGLGSDLIRPRSLVFDEKGLYFDPRGASDLEHLLNTGEFTAEELTEARTVARLVTEQGLTKYNIESREPVAWPSNGREVVLVPGQVEDDASIVHGCETVRSNLGLIQAARVACPDAFIVFKPHPDVLSGNRRGQVPVSVAGSYADHVETHASVVSCLEAADAVHTMTSLTGFEALLRSKCVVVYGRPFYAGWGLTEDRLPIPRRTRHLALDELVAGVLLRYPLYWDWELKGFTSCEAVLRGLIEERGALLASGRLERLNAGWLRRQLRKIRSLAKGAMPVK